MELGGVGRVEAVVAVTKVEFVLEVERHVASDVELKKEAVLQNGLLAFVAPGVNAFVQFRIMFFGLVNDFLQRFGIGTFEDEEAHEVKLVAESNVAVPNELELVTQGEACAEVVSTYGKVVGCGSSEGNG